MIFAFGEDRLPKRFWARVSLSESGCWLWTGAVKRTYPTTRHVTDWHQQVYAHRLAYEILVGPIADGLQLDHLCRIRHCVNPAHLEPVTARVNILRGATLAAANSAKIQCSKGHPFDNSNTRIDPKTGKRHCRICCRENMRIIRANKRAA